jgi:spermidine synthase
MSEPTPTEPASLLAPERCLPWLLLLFVGSGCAALIYEIIWFQLLQLVIGSSAVSLGVLLGTYMGGMCLGSLMLPRLISTRQHPLRVYALLELGIGAVALIVLFGMPVVSGVYAGHVGTGPAGIVWRGLLCGILLLPPTLLMGATLPAIARWVEATPKGVSWLGFFYGGNIAGAVCGCLLAGFYLLRVYDVATATCVAVAINGAVALIGLSLATRSEGRGGSRAAAPVPAKTGTARWASWSVYLAVALSGMTALAAEVIWTRLLSLLLGGTVYTFSIILSVVLTGLGIGSAAGSALARGSASPRLLLGACQLFLALAVAWAAFQLTRSLPFWPINPYLSTDPTYIFQLDLLRCAWALLPAACLWGATFPLALAAVASREQDAGRLVGRVYAANTLGAIVGAVATSVLLIGWVGTQHVQQGLILFSLANGLLMLAPLAGRAPDGAVARRRAGGAMAVAAALAAGLWLTQMVGPVPWQLVAYGRYLSTVNDGAVPLYLGEGMNASVAVTQMPSGARSFHISGKVEASSLAQDMRLQRMLGHLPALFHPAPKSVLVVGCGAGVTAGSFLLHPGVERIVICELEPLIPKVVAEQFGKENYHVVRDPRVEVVYDDARHFILTTPEKFDIITSDPIHPWVKGAATLYTTEYFELCKRRLKPGGLVTQWVPLYESTLDVVKSEMATFFQVFPSGTVWSNDDVGKGYDIVLLGQAEPLTLDVDRLQARLDQPDHTQVRESLQEVGLASSYLLLSTYAGRATDLQSWLAGAEINRDRSLRLQYLAGIGLNTQMSAPIYSTLQPYRRFPTGLMVGSTELLRPLRKALQPGQGDPAPSGGANLPPWERL